MNNSKEREPWLALILSIIFPGLGQIYYGNKVRGIFILVLYSLLLAFGVCFVLSVSGNALLGYILLLLALLIALLSHIDSFFTSRRNNSISFERLRKSSKDPWFSVFLNYIIPGIGHFYIQKWIVGLIIIFGYIIAFVADVYLETFYLISSCYVVFVCWLVYESSGQIREKSHKIIVLILVGIFLSLLISENTDIVKKYFYQNFKIPSGAMAPILIPGDHVLVKKYKQNINYGDVIVFIYPNSDNEPSKKGVHYIKRVVGMPGDSIDVEGRNLIINGDLISLSNPVYRKNEITHFDVIEYEENIFDNIHKVYYQKDKPATAKGEYLPVDKIPDGHVFVLGDNRDNSRDSRYWGFVPIEDIVGKPYKIHWSWDLQEGNWLFNKVRWDRISKEIK